jgi:hypothetical protein
MSTKNRVISRKRLTNYEKCDLIQAELNYYLLKIAKNDLKYYQIQRIIHRKQGWRSYTC